MARFDRLRLQVMKARQTETSNRNCHCSHTRTLGMATILVVGLLRCSTIVVSKSGPSIVGSRTIQEEPILKVLSVPSVESDTARFLCTRLRSTEQTRAETTRARIRLSDAGKTMLGGGSLVTMLAGVALENRGYPGYVSTPVSYLGGAGLVFAIMSACGLSWTRTSVARTVDTVKTREQPGTVEVLADGRVVATIYVDGNGIAEFPVQRYLQSLGDSLRDSMLTVRMSTPGTASSSFPLTRKTVIAALERQAADLARRNQEEQERREAAAYQEKAAAELARYAPLAAEVDTVCRVIEGLGCAYGVGAVVIYHEMSGSLDSGRPDAAQYAREQAAWFDRCSSMYRNIRKPSRFRATYAVIDELLPGLSRLVELVTEMVDRGGLTSSAAEDLSRTWKHLYPEGKRALFVRIEKPLRQDLRACGLSESVVGSIWENLKLSCWTREVKMGSTVVLPPQRDSVYRLILEDLRSSSGDSE